MVAGSLRPSSLRAGEQNQPLTHGTPRTNMEEKRKSVDMLEMYPRTTLSSVETPVGDNSNNKKLPATMMVPTSVQQETSVGMMDDVLPTDHHSASSSTAEVGIVRVSSSVIIPTTPVSVDAGKKGFFPPSPQGSGSEKDMGQKSHISEDKPILENELSPKSKLSHGKLPLDTKNDVSPLSKSSHGKQPSETNNTRRSIEKRQQEQQIISPMERSSPRHADNQSIPSPSDRRSKKSKLKKKESASISPKVSKQKKRGLGDETIIKRQSLSSVTSLKSDEKAVDNQKEKGKPPPLDVDRFTGSSNPTRSLQHDEDELRKEGQSVISERRIGENGESQVDTPTVQQYGMTPTHTDTELIGPSMPSPTDPDKARTRASARTRTSLSKSRRVRVDEAPQDGKTNSSGSSAIPEAWKESPSKRAKEKIKLLGQEHLYPQAKRMIILICDSITHAVEMIWPPSSIEAVWDVCELNFEFLEREKYDIECHHVIPSSENKWIVPKGEKQIQIEIYFNIDNGISAMFELAIFLNHQQLYDLLPYTLNNNKMELLKVTLTEFTRRITSTKGTTYKMTERLELFHCLVDHLPKLRTVPSRLLTDVLQAIPAALEILHEDVQDPVDPVEFFLLCQRGFSLSHHSPFFMDIFMASCDFLLLLCSLGGDPDMIIDSPQFDTILNTAINIIGDNLICGTTACEALCMLARKEKGIRRLVGKWDVVIPWILQTLKAVEKKSPKGLPEWVLPALQVALFRLWGMIALANENCRQQLHKSIEYPKKITYNLLEWDLNNEQEEPEEGDIIGASLNAIAGSLMNENMEEPSWDDPEFLHACMSILKRYGDDADVLDNCCRCLALSVTSAFIKENMTELIDILLNLIEKHREEMQFITNTFHLLGICFRREIQTIELLTEQVLQKFVIILKEEPFHPELQENGMYVLAITSLGNEKNRQILIKEGAEQLCKVAIGQFPDNLHLIEQATRAQEMLTKDQGWRFW